MLLPGGTNANHELVKQGRCWWYRKYAPGDTVLEKLETEAQEAQKGLWAGAAVGAEEKEVTVKSRRPQTVLSSLLPLPRT